jgi:hypothetical protein
MTMSANARAGRILDALDELVGQESVLLRSLDLVEALQIAERCAPLVDEICQLATEPAGGEIQGRVAALLQKRQRNAALLETHVRRVQEEMRRIEDARRKLSRMAPAYRAIDATRAPTERNLNTAA